MKSRPALLIVDDELSNLQKLQRTFISDFVIRQAQSGDEALTLLQNAPVDVIITDQKMAGMTGVELLSASLEWCPDARRIILTGYTEVDYLMDAINQGQVHRYITKPWQPFPLKQTVLQDLEHFQLKRQNQVLEEQFRIAKEVQRHLFPRVLPRFEKLEFCGFCKPAWQVGGDFFDFLRLSETEFCVAVGDISGKGISAALLMASLQALLRSHAPYHRKEISRLLGDVNRLLCAMTDDRRFATCFYAVFDAEVGSITYGNAGHNPPFLMRAAGSDAIVSLPASGLMLGVFESSTYDQVQLPFEPGDTLIIYTDGIVEAQNARSEEFGEERLRQALRDHIELPPRELKQRIITLLEEIVAGHEQSDDLTLVVVRRV